ncbi:outer membrane beta-barrel protein [Vibrio sp. SM6]|uniref:Outer membrane beta-barrel protein n=1 Tax=Vibrio agarilyticus TaxID=2726741 RepID=A0A7X8TT93_9VIBR|nr:outer membrane beta-barrel protein [Vibrio agarilyticus]NLS14388.1 outer membrane beta-barrel protein [Vibrio agarilyticus]
MSTRVMSNNKPLIVRSLTFFLAYPSIGFAALSPNPIDTSSGISVTPYLNLEWAYDDNYTQSSKPNSSHIYSASPRLEFVAERGASSFGLDVSSSSNFYSTDSNFDHTNFYVDANANLDLNIRNRLILNAGYAYEYDTPGSGATEGLGDVINELTKYDDVTLQALYQYGADGAKGRLSVSGQYFKKRYKNFRHIEGEFANRSTRFKDNDKVTLGAQLDINARDDVYWFVDVSVADSKFPNDSIQDNKHYLYYIGTSWDLTGKTQGSLKVGWQDKRYDTTYSDFDSLSWSVGLTWTPFEHSTIGFDTGKVAEDPSVGNGTNDSTSYSAYWKHSWFSAFSTRLATNYKDDRYTVGGRKDKTRGFGGSATYQFNRWSEMTLGADRTIKESNRENFGYDQWITSLALVFTI